MKGKIVIVGLITIGERGAKEKRREKNEKRKSEVSQRRVV